MQGLQTQINDIDLGTQLQGRVPELEESIRNVAGGGGDSGRYDASLGKDDAIKALEYFSGNPKDDKISSFEKFESVISDQVKLRPSWAAVLEKAHNRGEMKWELSEFTPLEARIATELWAVLGQKLNGDAWDFLDDIRKMGNNLIYGELSTMNMIGRRQDGQRQSRRDF